MYQPSGLLGGGSIEMIFVVDVSQDWIPPIGHELKRLASLSDKALARQVLTALSDSVQVPCDTRHQVDRECQTAHGSP